MLTSSISAAARSMVAGSTESRGASGLDTTCHAISSCSISTSYVPRTPWRWSTPRAVEALPWGSMSTRRTLNPPLASEAARFTAVVVFPTPPFWLTTTMTRVPEGRGNVSRETVPLIAPSGASLMRSPLVNATPPTAWNHTGRRLQASPADHRSVPTTGQGRLDHLYISFSLSHLLALSTLAWLAYPTPVATLE